MHTLQRDIIDQRVFSQIHFGKRSSDCEDNIMITPTSKNKYSECMNQLIPSLKKTNDLDDYQNQKSVSKVSIAQSVEFENNTLTQSNSTVKRIKNHIPKHTKFPRRLNLASRSDVVNKCSIRKLRRHFWTLFRINNK